MVIIIIRTAEGVRSDLLFTMSCNIWCKQEYKVVQEDIIIITIIIVIIIIIIRSIEGTIKEIAHLERLGERISLESTSPLRKHSTQRKITIITIIIIVIPTIIIIIIIVIVIIIVIIMKQRVYGQVPCYGLEAMANEGEAADKNISALFPSPLQNRHFYHHDHIIITLLLIKTTTS